MTITTVNSSIGKLEKNPGDAAPIFDFRVKVDKASDRPFGVNVATDAGTAVGGEDYVARIATLQFAGNANEEHIFSVTGMVDTKLELDEVFYSVVGAVTQTSGRAVIVGNPSSAGATILNDDMQSEISVTGSTVTEGNSGTTSMMFTLTLAQAVDHDVVVTVLVYGLSADAAGADRDFNPPPNDRVTVTIPAGQTTATFAVAVVGDTRDEEDEYIGARIESIDAGEFDVIAAAQTEEQRRGTITDDDGP